jgi:hypothetical protein
MKKTSGYFHLALNLHLLTIGEECDLIMGLDYATNTQIVNVPMTQLALQALATTVRNDLGSRATDPHPTLTKLEQQHVDAMTRGLLGVSSDVVRQANAIAIGNPAIFQTLLRSIGFNPAKPHAKHTRIFQIKTTTKGTIEIIIPSESGKGLGHPTYLYEYGIAAAENVLPATWQPVIPLSDAEFYVSGIPSTSIVAVRYAVVLIPSHKNTVGSAAASKRIAPPASPNKMITILPVNSKGKVVLVHGTTFYTYSDVIYIVVS